MKSQLLKTPLPYLALVFSNIIWGANFVIAKVTLEEIPVLILAFLRFFFAALFLLPFFFSLKDKHKIINRKDLLKILFVGFFLTTLHITFFYEGLKRTTSIDASILSLITPILSLLLAWWFLKEKIYPVNILGSALALIGSIIILGLPAVILGTDGKYFLGNLLIIISSVVIVWGYLLIKERLQDYPPLVITTSTFIIGALTFSIPALLQNAAEPEWIVNISFEGVLGLLFIIFFSSIAAFFLHVWGLERIDLGKANLSQYVQPFIAAFLAIIILGEEISIAFAIGSAFIIIGVYLGTLGKAHHHHSHYKH